MSSRSSFIGKLVLAFTLAGCGEAYEPTQQTKQDDTLTISRAVDQHDANVTQDNSPAVPKVANNPRVALVDQTWQNKYVLQDGSVDRMALRRDFGEANKNVELNPRATDLAKTADVKNVQVLNDRIVFTGSDAAWVLNHETIGDTLYCGPECGAQGFVRNVVSINEMPDRSVEVITANGALTDIIHRGWIHAEMPVSIPVVDNNGKVVAGWTPQGSYNTNITKSLYTYNQTFSKSFGSGNLTGSVSANPTFNLSVEVDIAIDYSILPPDITVNLFKVAAIGKPGLSLTGNLNAKGDYSQDWTIVNLAGTNLGSIGAGPISLGFTLDLKITGHVEAGGTVTMAATASAADQLTVGFQYSSGAGVSPVYGNSFTKSYSFNMSGKANAKFMAEMDGKISASFVGSSAYISVTATAGAEGTVSLNADVNSQTGANTCSAKLEGQCFATLGSKAGANVSLLGYSLFNKDYTLADYNWFFPDPKWEKTLTINDASQCIPGFCPGANQQWCNGKCVNTATDKFNCGGCGENCDTVTGDPKSTCQASACICHCTDGSLCGSTNVSTCP